MPDDSGGIRADISRISKPLKEYEMKKILFLGAMLALAGCAGEKKAEAPASSEAPAAGANPKPSLAVLPGFQSMMSQLTFGW